MSWGKLNKIYLPNLKWSIGQFKVLRSSVDRISWIVFCTGRASKVGLVNIYSVALLIFPHQYWFIKAIILLDQWFNACTVVSNGNFRVSSRTGLLFGPTQVYFWPFFFIKPIVFRFPILFFLFWGQLLGIYSQFFQVVIGGASLWTKTEILLVVLLEAVFFVEISTRWFSLSSRKSSFEFPGTLLWPEQLAKCMVSNNSWT